MSDRHERWTPVEPGTVIPAGQPYRVVFEDQSAIDFKVTDGGGDVFVDSSWKPPLVLPTEPTWGIALSSNGNIGLAKWALARDGKLIDSHQWGGWSVSMVTDFIPLTDEQVARIEAAR